MKDKQIQHWKNVVALQEKLKANLAKMISTKEKIQDLQQEVKEAKENLDRKNNKDNIAELFTYKSKSYELNELLKSLEILTKNQDETEKKLQDLEASPPR